MKEEKDFGRIGTLVVDLEMAVEDVVRRVDPVCEMKPKEGKFRDSEACFYDGCPTFIGSGENVVGSEPGKKTSRRQSDPAVATSHMVLFSDERIGQFPNGAGLIEGDIKTTIRDREFPCQHGSFDAVDRRNRLRPMLLQGKILRKESPCGGVRRGDEGKEPGKKQKGEAETPSPFLRLIQRSSSD